MKRRAGSKVGAWVGLAGLLVGTAACADDPPGTGETASSSGSGSSSSTAGPGATGPGATGPGATAADTTAADTTAADTTAGVPSTGSTTADGTSSTGSGSTGSTSAGTTTDGTSSDGGEGTSSSGGSAVCGNGVIDAAEQCDGNDLQGFDCGSLGLGGGTLGCDAATCTFDTSMCGAMGNCGNGLINPGEQCDGPNLQGFDCASLGLGGGMLACDPITCTFDTSMCLPPGGGTSG